MKIRILLLLILFLLVWATVASARPQTHNNIYLPMLYSDQHNKRGIGFAMESDGWGVVGLRPSWAYNWGIVDYPDMPDIPQKYMIWCTGGFFNQLKALEGPGFAGDIFMLNEPEDPKQCNRTVEKQVELYREVREYYPKARISAPHAAHAWAVEDFWQEIDRLNADLPPDEQIPFPDAAGIHEYVVHPSHTEQKIIDEIEDLFDLLDQIDPRPEPVPVILSEFGFDQSLHGSGVYHEPTAQMRVPQLRRLLDWLDANDRVIMYAMYTTRHDCVKHPGWCEERFTDAYFADGALTPVGEEYKR